MRRLSLSLFLLFLLTLVYFHPGASGTDGSELFIVKCGACHKKGGDAPELAPVKYAGVQWERFFDRNKHARKKDIADRFTDAEMASIKQFLIDHAADSDRPIVAGVK